MTEPTKSPEPLDVLLMEEERVVLMGEESLDPVRKEVNEAFPYLRLYPYIDLIIAYGRLFRLEQLAQPESETSALSEITALLLDDVSNAKVVGQRSICDHFRRQALEAAKRLGDGHGVAVSENDLQAYLPGLAKRALDYADRHLPGISMESPNFAQVKEEVQGLNVYNALRRAVEAVRTPSIRVSEAVYNIRLFHE